MNVIICLDDNNGMMFNNRRQSRDCSVIGDILNFTDGHRLLIDKFSSPLFENKKENITEDNNFLTIAGKHDYCFVENHHLQAYTSSIESIIVYRWNRVYPADFFLDIDISEWKIKASDEFKGFSHEKITKEVYIK